jgi:hypothetical protein
VRVTGVAALTVPAVTVNVTEVWPCGTVAVAGTLAAVVLELESDTVMPPLPAAAVRLTVPVADPPLAIALELTVRLLSAGGGGLTVIPNVALTPQYEAVKVTEVAELTVPAVTVKVAEVWPWGTMTDVGTFAPTGDELSAIVVPPLGADDVSETEQVEPEDGLIEIGLQVRPLNLAVWTIVTVPPAAEVAMTAPSVFAEIPLSWSDDVVFVVDDESVNVAYPTTPFGHWIV